MKKGIDLQKERDWTSRKYRAAWLLTFVFIGLLVIPSVVTLFLNIFWGSIEFNVLPVEAFVTFITLIWAAYFGANVTEKHKSFKHKPVVANLLDEVSEDEGNDAGGQPEESIGNEP